MSENKHDSSRVGLVIDIKLSTADNKEYILKSRNISDKGTFLEYDGTQLDLPINTHVTLQVCSMLDDQPPPAVKAKIVKQTNDGIELRFIF